MKTSLKLFVVLCAIGGIKTQSWTYSDQEAWKSDFPMCSGNRQSPIQINAMETTTKSFPALRFSNYEDTREVTLINNGKTAEIEYEDDGVKPQISGGPLERNSRYQLANVHFHWGVNDSLGAEHVINNQRNSMEVHVVHYNLKYRNLNEAANNADGIAVVTVFYLATPNQGLAGLQSVVNALPEIIQYNSTTEINRFQLSALIGGLNKRTYYTYSGSLTTPPCSEAVTWIIYPNPIAVRSSQLVPFRQLRDMNGNPLVDNFRNLQKRNGRKIYLGRNKMVLPLVSSNNK